MGTRSLMSIAVATALTTRAGLGAGLFVKMRALCKSVMGSNPHWRYTGEDERPAGPGGEARTREGSVIGDL